MKSLFSLLCLTFACCGTTPTVLVFGSSRTGNGDLYATNLETGVIQPLVRTADPAFNPRWDASRERLVFLTDSAGSLQLNSLVGGQAESIGPSPADEEPVDWAPDGSAYVFTTERDGNRDIFVWDLEAETERRLTTDPGPDLQPRWSPDSKRIAFISSRSGNRDVWLIDRDGSNLRPVTRTEANEGHPSWHPNGAGLLYDADDTDDGLPDIFAHDLDTGARTNLTNAPGVDLIAEWSPCGEWIAFGSSRAGDWNVYVMQASGSELRQITEDPAFDGDPKWVPAQLVEK